MLLVASRREAIIAVVDAYNRAHPQSTLPRPAARLLGVMFTSDNICCQSLETLVAEGFTKNAVPGILRALVKAGLLSKQPGSARIPNTYRLHLHVPSACAA
jgi:hypothetical protein